MSATVWDESTEFEIVSSQSPLDVDGYKLGEPKVLRCAECGAQVLLTEHPSQGIDELGHDPHCGQRFAKTEWWRSHF